MRRKTAFSLLFIFLVGAFTPAQAKEDFALLPQLFEHFQKHLAADPTLTFHQFIHLHYCENPDANADRAGGHEDLPFKCTGHDHATAASQPPFFLTNEPPASAVVFELELIFESPVFRYADGFCSAGRGDIWQPPKA